MGYERRGDVGEEGNRGVTECVLERELNWKEKRIGCRFGEGSMKRRNDGGKDWVRMRRETYLRETDREVKYSV